MKTTYFTVTSKIDFIWTHRNKNKAAYNYLSKTMTVEVYLVNQIHKASFLYFIHIQIVQISPNQKKGSNNYKIVEIIDSEMEGDNNISSDIKYIQFNNGVKRKMYF